MLQYDDSLNKIVTIMNNEFPNWRNNKYLKTRNLKYKLVCYLAYKKYRNLLKFILNVNSKLK